ncbi:hypothetical protein IIC38_20005 [candidate division KSB1 bacterium]|nr:hypothetical protein [candidate division KSB1 bacterium]
MAIEKNHVDAMYNLALLYKTKYKDIKKAEQYYLMAAEMEDAEAMESLAWLYFKEIIHKKEAIKYAEQSYKKEKNIFIANTYAMVLLWHNEIEKAYEIANKFLKDSETFDQFPEDVRRFIMLLIAKKQYHLTLKIFNENPHHLKDRFKPIFYALMYFMQKEYPNEYRKMGSELKQTVEEIIEKIHQLAKDYA